MTTPKKSINVAILVLTVIGGSFIYLNRNKSTTLEDGQNTNTASIQRLSTQVKDLDDKVHLLNDKFDKNFKNANPGDVLKELKSFRHDWESTAKR